MQNLLIFGDSIIKGVMYNGQGYHLCRGHDFDRLAAQGVSVKNHAKMGATISDGQKRLACRLAEPCTPQTTVLFCFGGNDSDYDWRAIAAAPAAEHLPKTPPEAFIDGYCALIRAAQQAGARVALTSLPPIEPTRFFLHISKGLRADDILHWLGDVGHLYRWQEYYSSLVVQLSRAFGCRLVDVRTEFLKSRAFDTLLGADGIHPTQAGHDLIHATVQSALCF